jgi:hypothetical protein
MAIFPNMVGAHARVAVTIPDNTGTGANLLALMRAAGYAGPDTCAVRILPSVPVGTDRLAFVVANPRPNGANIAAADFATHGQYVSPGLAYDIPSDADARMSYVRSAAAATVPAVVLVCW